MRFKTKIINGKVENKQIGEHVKGLKDGNYVVVIKKGSVRTKDQNAYYWLILTVIGMELGYYPEELHNYFKVVYQIPTTTTLDVGEFAQYIERVRQFVLIELGIVTPDAEN